MKFILIVLLITNSALASDSLIEKHIQAIGGRENLSALKTISRIGNIEFFKTSYSPTSGKFKYHTDIVSNYMRFNQKNLSKIKNIRLNFVVTFKIT